MKKNVLKTTFEYKKTSKFRKNTAEEMPCRALFVKADNFSSDSESKMAFNNDCDLDVDMDDCTAEKDEVSVGDFVLYLKLP